MSNDYAFIFSLTVLMRTNSMSQLMSMLTFLMLTQFSIHLVTLSLMEDGVNGQSGLHVHQVSTLNCLISTATLYLSVTIDCQTTRNRSCDNPPPKWGGVPCDGEDFENQTCWGDECCPTQGT